MKIIIALIVLIGFTFAQDEYIKTADRLKQPN